MTDILYQVNRERFCSKWEKHLVRFFEYSDRTNPGETPLGRMSFLDPCHRILDIGCGCGNALEELKTKGHECVGLDLTYSNTQTARGKGGMEIVQGDFHDLPFNDQSFDGVLAWDVVEHSLSLFICLFEISRVLRPNGHLLMYVPPDHWADHPVHILIPNKDQMVSMCKKVGLSLEHQVDDPNCGKEWHIVKK